VKRKTYFSVLILRPYKDNMTTNYTVKKATDLTEEEVNVILKSWEVEEWYSLSIEQFKEKFHHSEFHLLKDDESKILCLARLNFDFKIRIQDKIYEFAELVGLVATVRMRGYAKGLLEYMKDNLVARNIETIGFCEKPLRPFYEKCNITIIKDRAKLLREEEGDGWIIPSDDDILVLNLSAESVNILMSLSSENPGYLIFS
jgi:hypothetical protein